MGGYTPQYYALNALTERYADRPFKILGFPCNQFLRQEPGANASEIYSVLRHVRPGDNFVPNFEMFAKSDVNGKDQNPIYEFLKSRCLQSGPNSRPPTSSTMSPTTKMTFGGILKSSWRTTRVNQCVAMTNHLIHLSLFQILTFFWASVSWTLQSKPSLIKNLSLQKSLFSPAS